MKVYLDDERSTPDGWVRTYTATQTIDLLKNGEVKELSLDHDLGEDPECGNGYDVVLWLEEEVFTTDFVPPQNINVHSANSSARLKMLSGIVSIYNIFQRRSNK